MEGEYRVIDRGNGKVLANVRIDMRDGGAYVFVQWFGEGEWEEDIEGLGLLLGDLGVVERVES